MLAGGCCLGTEPRVWLGCWGGFQVPLHPGEALAWKTGFK